MISKLPFLINALLKILTDFISFSYVKKGLLWEG